MNWAREAQPLKVRFGRSLKYHSTLFNDEYLVWELIDAFTCLGQGEKDSPIGDVSHNSKEVGVIQSST